MNPTIETSYRSIYRQRGLFRRVVSSALAICGGLTLTLALTNLLSEAAATWSPTATARNCFKYPETHIIPDSASIGQFMLSKAFFGNDALYFDLGDENTGISQLPQLAPSKNDKINTPQNSLNEDNTPIPQEPETRLPDDFDLYTYDYSKLSAGMLALLPYDLTQNPSPGEILFSNTTAYTVNADDYIDSEYPINTTLTEDKPLVLILHTHGTEAFVPEGITEVDKNSVQRSSDITENVVAVGKVMADKLNEAGIPTIHCETMHDLESYQNSYNLAADTIQKYIAAYPSIKYVFDVHRDAIVRTNGDLVKPVCLIDGKVSAQVMLLVGTNEKGADHPRWDKNMTVAVNLQNRLTRSHERFARPINIRGASFNEQFTPGSLLIEIGSAGNTLSEAKYAAEQLTYSIIEMIKENSN